MLGFVISLLGIGVGLANDARIHNTKIIGTSRDICMRNPERLRNRQACEEIYKKHLKDRK